MSRMSDGNGGHLEVDYDDKHDVTNWREYYDDGSPGGGGQEGGDKRADIEKHFEDKGWWRDNPSG